MQRNLIVIGFGLLIGAVIGFYLGWFVLPAELVEVTPADLETEFQDDYLRLIASTYAADQDLDEAADRLGSLGREDWPQWLLAETVDQLLSQPNSAETDYMVQLSIDLGIESPAFNQYVPSAEPVEEQ